ncbi:hypothetical protein HanHA300_Chr14g0522631 [Helianthus annuus]|nr:hypothetical protein HanHA300_Chr14g0522631 [Helianthus annuus]KAJ0485592.1 hypothetical protein HanHA89_Chr14g0570051 [Helianthus annuus]KAJ0656144.1 hypothetical protein HanLR1_Chr14g0532441 [Helianthus annuus]
MAVVLLSSPSSGFDMLAVDGDDEKKNVDFDDDGAAMTAEGRFLNLQPLFCSLLIIG